MEEKSKEKTKNIKKSTSLNGGGCRGESPAKVLKE